ncbi:hypothetical protein QAD02_007257 [Eretmocerus hayati]|uniref:Uncharacterized protein n=1 Tax=Eretmocerus hayati TaxID=131215 RepID=A0ACC2N7I0_9HYME|nr:hypothetical protein QAD02_007257 [Eretmocerus hayati]
MSRRLPSINCRNDRIIITLFATGSPVAYAAASWCTEHQEAVFVLAFSSSIISLVRMDILTGSVQYCELKQESVVPRFLSGLATAFRGRPSETKDLMCLTLHPYRSDVQVFALCRDGYMRVWSCSTSQILSITEIFGSQEQNYSIHNVQLKKTTVSDGVLLLCVYLQCQSRSEFQIHRVVQGSDSIRCIRLGTLPTPDVSKQLQL